MFNIKSLLFLFLKTITLDISVFQEEFFNYKESQDLNREPENLYKPISYILSLGGKKIRPVLTLMAAEILIAFIPVVGPVLALMLGAAVMGIQYEDMGDRMILSSGGNNPYANPLGVKEPSGFEKVMMSVGAILLMFGAFVVAKSLASGTRGTTAVTGAIDEGSEALARNVDDLPPVKSGGGTPADDLPVTGKQSQGEGQRSWVHEEGYVEPKMAEVSKGRGGHRSIEPDYTTNGSPNNQSNPNVEPPSGSTIDEIRDVHGAETARGSPETRTRRDGTNRQMSAAEADRVAQGQHITYDDLRGMERRTKVSDSHDMGVQQGRLEAQKNNIVLENWNNPESYIGLYGRGIDDLGRDGSKWIILEWKGGKGSRLASRQMSSEWVGRKLAELKHLNDPMSDTLLNAARSGQLEGRVFRTVADDTVTTVSNPIHYNFADVNVAYIKRLSELN